MISPLMLCNSLYNHITIEQYIQRDHLRESGILITGQKEEFTRQGQRAGQLLAI